MKIVPVFLLLIICFPFQGFSQDEVLLSIDNQPILLSEFERIYHKNNHVQGYENKPASEYLDMFVNFKLKVLEARNLGYDTLPSFINELAGYREQLSRPYLQDRQLIDQLMEEAYYRTLNEVNASHIMVKLAANAPPEDTLAAYNKALSIRNRLLAGESFEKVARMESEDPSARINNGRLGWFSAFSMVYPFENAAYQTKEGGLSMPVRSKYGYHIIKVNGFRPALGEIKLAHILVRAGRNDDLPTLKAAREKIDSCYALLQSGKPFNDLVKMYSEDTRTARNNGQMRWLRSGELPSDIEEKVYALSDSGAYTEPVKSEYGWHIFQLQGKRPIAPFNQIRAQLEERILIDERGKQIEEAFLARLKNDYHFKSYPENISMIDEMIDSSIYDGNWDPTPAGNLIEPVFTFDNQDVTQQTLVDFITKTKRYSKNESFAEIVDRKYNELVNRELFDFEKQQLEEKYPAFRYLMEEYHDGILLFNIMDDKVWSKAVKDSVGLQAFYKQYANKYQWKERADISMYTLNDPELLKSVTKLAKKRSKVKWSADEFRKMVCPTDSISCIKISDTYIETGEEQPMNGFNWKKGYIKHMRKGNDIQVLVVNDLIPPAPKTFAETQGQVTADYQDYLDKQWIEALRGKYTVVVNNQVLQMVK